MKRTTFLLTVFVSLLPLGLCITWAANGQEPAVKATDAGQSVQAPAKATSREIMYKNQSRDDAWFDQMYAKFNDKIANVDGKYIDVGLARLRPEPEEVRAEPPKPGTELRTTPVHSNILQVLGKEEVLVKRDAVQARLSGGYRGDATDMARSVAEAGASLSEVIFHVRGLDTSRFVNGAAFPQVDLIYAGTYTYPTSGGATNTVQSFLVYKPLTRDKFAEALSSGFVLVDYKLALVPNCSNCRGTGKITVQIPPRTTLKGTPYEKRVSSKSEECPTCKGMGYKSEPGLIFKDGKHYRVVSKFVP